MHDKFGPKGVQVIGITKSDGDSTRQFRSATGAKYPMLSDAGELRERYGVRLLMGTQVYLVDPEGKVRSRDMDEIETILAEEVDA